MLLADYVRRNWVEVKLRYGYAVQKDKRHDWAGSVTHFPRLWEKGDHCRLYVPLSTISTAGYIDLHRQTIHPELTMGRHKVKAGEEDFEYARDKLSQVLKELQEEAVKQ